MHFQLSHFISHRTLLNATNNAAFIIGNSKIFYQLIEYLSISNVFDANYVYESMFEIAKLIKILAPICVDYQKQKKKTNEKKIFMRSCKGM